MAPLHHDKVNKINKRTKYEYNGQSMNTMDKIWIQYNYTIIAKVIIIIILDHVRVAAHSLRGLSPRSLSSVRRSSPSRSLWNRKPQTRSNAHSYTRQTVTEWRLGPPTLSRDGRLRTAARPAGGRVCDSLEAEVADGLGEPGERLRLVLRVLLAEGELHHLR